MSVIPDPYLFLELADHLVADLVHVPDYAVVAVVEDGGGFGIIEAVSPLSMSRAEAMRPETAKFNICQTVKRLLTNE